MTSSLKTGAMGEGEHPTQALLDLYTIKKEKGEIDDLKILFVGNVGSRAVHSLGIGLAKFRNVQAYVLTSEAIGIPDVVKKDFKDIRYKIVSSIEEVAKDVDVIYLISIKHALGLEKTPDVYVVDQRKLRDAKPNLIVLHPLPRGDEIPVELDRTARAKYFTQAGNGVVVRMAVLALVLGRAS